MSSNKDPADALTFQGRHFCFTGKLLDLKRSEAQQQVRARGGLTSNSVNDHLDYLVIGSKPSTGWKFGNYGNKIEKALKITDAEGHLRIVSEEDFMEALAQEAETNSGAIDAKVVVCKYETTCATAGDIDTEAVSVFLQELREGGGCHVSLRSFPVASRKRLFDDEDYEDTPDDWLIIHCRVVKQMPLEDDPQNLADMLGRRLGDLLGREGRYSWFERKEGTAGYIRLLRQVPESLRLPDI